MLHSQYNYHTLPFTPFNKALSSYIYMYIYMLAIAGQTAGPNWLNFFEETLGYSGGNIDKKYFFLQN